MPKSALAPPSKVARLEEWMTRVHIFLPSRLQLSQLPGNEAIPTMQSIGTAACLRRSLRVTSRSLGCLERGLVARQCLTASHRAQYQSARATQSDSIRRAFSTSTPRRLADINDDFNPKTTDRESDQVDVCIVGGGMFLIDPS